MKNKCNCNKCPNQCPTCGGCSTSNKEDNKTQENNNTSVKMNLNDTQKNNNTKFNLND